MNNKNYACLKLYGEPPRNGRGSLPPPLVPPSDNPLSLRTSSFRVCRLPVIISGSEDGTVRIWHSTTYRAETTLNYGMERVWALAASSDSNK